jgi:amidophosphoribosyltransferase
MFDSEEESPLDRFEVDKLHEECGVFALYGHPEAANLVYLGLYALQHRGQESAGIASSDGRKIHNVRSLGHVAEIFTPDVLNQLPGELAIGHTRNHYRWHAARGR